MHIRLLSPLVLAPAVIQHTQVGPVVGICGVKVGGHKEVRLRLLVAVQLAQRVGQVEVKGWLIR